MLEKIKFIIINQPWIWNTFQNFVGANPWKNRLYPSVFEKRGGKLMDFGCSQGNNTEAFLDFEYYGYDLDAEAIAAAKERWKGYENVHFEAGDILKDDSKTGFFDHIIFACTGHHLRDDEMRPILSALLTKLAPGGSIHFFDVIKQPQKDRYITRLIMNNDQGKNMRTREQYAEIFKNYNVTKHSEHPSPNRMIKLQDMVYYRIQNK